MSLLRIFVVYFHITASAVFVFCFPPSLHPSNKPHLHARIEKHPWRYIAGSLNVAIPTHCSTPATLATIQLQRARQLQQQRRRQLSSTGFPCSQSSSQLSSVLLTETSLPVGSDDRRSEGAHPTVPPAELPSLLDIAARSNG